jgi:hypothetical protein
MSTPDDA